MDGAMIGAVGLGAVVLVVLLVLAQPNRAWQDSAEHSKRFWCVWALTFVTIGLAPALVAGAVPEAWSWSLIWLLVCCAGAVLQPALYTDLRDVRRTRRHQREALTAPQLRVARPAPSATPTRMPEIKWYAPGDRGLDDTRPDYTRPDYTRPDYTRPDYTRMGTSA